MGVIWTSNTRNRQPRLQTALDPIFTSGDGFAWTPHFLAEARGGAISNKGSTTVRSVLGEEAAYATSSTDAQRVPGRKGFVFGKTLFVFRFIHQGGSASFTFGYGRNDASPSLYVEQFDANMDENGSTSVGKFRFVLRDIAGSSLMCGPSSALLTTGVLNTVVLAATSSSTVVGWVNGSPITFSYSSTGAADNQVGLPNKEFGILNFNYGGGDGWASFSGADTNLGASLVARVIVPNPNIGGSLSLNPWQLFAAEKRPAFFDVTAGSNNTGTLSSTLDAATLTGVGAVTRSGTLAVTLDAATLAGIGTAAVTNKTGTLAVTLDVVTLAGVGAVTRSGTLAVTLDAATLAGVGTVAVGTNRDGTLASTLADVTLTGVGAVTRSGTLSVTLNAATLAGIGSVGQPLTGTLSATLDNVTLRGIGAIPAAPSTGGGKTTGKNLSRKQKKKLKAVESQEWLKAEETARQLLSDRFTKQTPQEKAQALETYIESLQPVIEALKALTSQIEEVVEEAPVIELTPHQEVIQRFDRLEKKVKSVEELIIILMADL